MKCKEKILKLIRLSIFVHFAACGYSLIILAHQPPFHYVQTKHAPTSRLRAHQSLCFTFLFLKYPHELLLYPCWCITFFWRAFLLYEDWHPLLVYHLIKIYFFHIQINTRHYVIYIFSCLIPVSPNSFMRARNCLVSSLSHSADLFFEYRNLCVPSRRKTIHSEWLFLTTWFNIAPTSLHSVARPCLSWRHLPAPHVVS